MSVNLEYQIEQITRRIYDLQRQLQQLEAQMSSGQQSYDVSVVPADYSHKHRSSSLIDLDSDDDYVRVDGSNPLTATWRIGAQKIELANGATYYLDTDGDAYFKSVNLGDSEKLNLGAAPAANIFHDGSHLYLDNNTGNYYEYYDSKISRINGIFYIQDADDGNATRLQIDSADGRFDIFGGFGAIDVNFADGTTYKVEADGDAIFKDLHILDSAHIYVGTGNDLDIYHNAANSFIDNDTGNLYVQSTGNIVIDTVDRVMIRDVDDSSEVLWDFNSNNREFIIGATDGNDDVAVKVYGKINILDGFGAIDVNFANGTTYKVEADGDAFFKEGTFTGELKATTALDTTITIENTEAAQSDNEPIGQLNWDAGEAGIITIAQIQVLGDQVWTAGQSGSRMVFSTTKSGTLTLTEAMRIDLHQNIIMGKDGGATNYANFADDGELTLYGTARVEKAIDMAGATFEKGGTAPTAIVVGNYLAWEYTKNDDSVITFELPHDWASGTDLTIKVDWAVDDDFADVSGEVQWNVSWTATPHDASETLTHASTTLDPGDINIPANANTLTRTTMGTIAGASLAVEDEIGLKIERVALDGGNDPQKDPYITHIYVSYIADKLGEAT